MKNQLAIEQRQQLRMTAELIHRSGRDIVLHRPAPAVSDGAGGAQRPVEGDEDPALDPQRLYFGGKINNRMTNLPFETRTAIGEMVSSVAVIVGMPVDKYRLLAADIEEDDWFELNGKRYTVQFVHHNRNYQIKAEVKFVGT